jgi:hypothetical protein
MKVVTYWRCDYENMEINLESIRNGGYCFECNITCLSSSKIYRKRHLVGKNYFAVENIEVIAEGN